MTEHALIIALIILLCTIAGVAIAVVTKQKGVIKTLRYELEIHRGDRDYEKAFVMANGARAFFKAEVDRLLRKLKNYADAVRAIGAERDALRLRVVWLERAFEDGDDGRGVAAPPAGPRR